MARLPTVIPSLPNTVATGHMSLVRLEMWPSKGRGKIYTELEDLLQTVNDLLHTFTVII